MQDYIIGIDTGGTYTDAVLIDRQSLRVVATAKKPTTHHDLAIATGQALTELFRQSGVAPGQIASLAVSSTLATNSVVENKGARVVLLVIGYVRHFKLPVKAVVFITGGHTITGQEEEPLDLEYLVEIVHNLKDEVDAYGVCSAMAMHNPAEDGRRLHCRLSVADMETAKDMEGIGRGETNFVNQLPAGQLFKAVFHGDAAQSGGLAQFQGSGVAGAAEMGKDFITASGR